MQFILFYVGEQGDVCLDDLVHRGHPHLPDPLPQLRTVLGTPHVKKKVTEQGNTDVQLQQCLQKTNYTRIKMETRLRSRILSSKRLTVIV